MSDYWITCANCHGDGGLGGTCPACGGRGEHMNAKYRKPGAAPAARPPQDCVMDFPTAWAFVREQHSDVKDHDRRCSWAQTNGGVLCDCHILNTEYERRKAAAELQVPENETRRMSLLRILREELASLEANPPKWKLIRFLAYARPHDPQFKRGIDVLMSVNVALHAVESPWRIDVKDGQAIAVPTPEIFSALQAARPHPDLRAVQELAADLAAQVLIACNSDPMKVEQLLKAINALRDAELAAAQASQRGQDPT